MLFWIAIVVLGCAIVFIAVWPFVIEARRPEVDPAERESAKGEFLQLSQGLTHYRWAGSTRGPVAVVAHGLTTSSIAMEPLAEALGRLGFRVLLYDLYGRGLSDTPPGRKNRAYFKQQLTDLCGALDLTEDLTVVGQSMGGSVATSFAAEFPHSVKHLILISPAGLGLSQTRRQMFCAKVPLLGDWAHAMFARRQILSSIPPKGRDPVLNKIYDARRKAVDRKGYLPALLSCRRQVMSDAQEEDHRKLFRQGIRVTAIWAELDRVIPKQAIGLLGLWNRNARHDMIEGAGHSMVYTHREELAAALHNTFKT